MSFKLCKLCKTFGAFLILIFCIFLFETRASNPSPNFILILIDDLGWGDLGCYGNDFVETPNIDQLAKDGIRFTDFYASGSVCSPTRCAIQSGQNQARIGITDFISGHWRPFEKVITPRPKAAFPSDIVSLAEALKKAKYETGYVGKWHLGMGRESQPDRHGYDVVAVLGGGHLPGSYHLVFEKGFGKDKLQNDESQNEKDEFEKVQNDKVQNDESEFDESHNDHDELYRTDFEADLAVKFIHQNIQKGIHQKKHHPFFLMISPYAVHIPLGAMSSKVQKYRQKIRQDVHQKVHKDGRLPHPVYASMIEHCDDLVGKIVDAVSEFGIEKSTMILLTSDNGGLFRRYDFQPEIDESVTSLSPFRGEKGNLYEGGIRVPLIVKYPPLIRSGSVSDEPSISYDFYPTFLKMARADLHEDQTFDGKDLSPIFKNPSTNLDRDLFWHYPHYHHGRPSSCIRDGEWKLIEYLDGTKDVELFNLNSDIAETENLSRQEPDRLAFLKKKLRAWRRKVIAEMPFPNPAYDPDRAHEWWNVRTGRPIQSQKRRRFPQTEKDDQR